MTKVGILRSRVRVEEKLLTQESRECFRRTARSVPLHISWDRLPMTVEGYRYRMRSWIHAHRKLLGPGNAARKLMAR